MRRSVLSLTAGTIVLSSAATAHANNERRVTPDDLLLVEFRVEPGSTTTPDTFVVYLGQPEALEPGTRFHLAQLSNRGVGIAVHPVWIFGDIVGPLDLDPGAVFTNRGTPYSVLDPGHVDVGGLRTMAQGTESGHFLFFIETGALIVDLDDVRLEWGVGTGPDTYTPSDVQPEITFISVGSPCYADFDRSGEPDVFDFLAFQNAFALGDFRADCDIGGSLDIFDFLCFLSAFDAGCP